MSTLVVVLLASTGCAKLAGHKPPIFGTWERVEETGSASLLSSGMFSYYVFTVHGDVIASDGFCAGFLTTYDISGPGSLKLEQASREQRRIDAIEEVRIEVGGFWFTDDEEAEETGPPPTAAEVEAAYQRARSKPEGDRTELESVAFSYLSEFDEEHDCVNEFEITEVTANRLVLKKSNGTGHIRFKRKEKPLNPTSFYAGGASDTEDPQADLRVFHSDTLGTEPAKTPTPPPEIPSSNLDSR